MLQILNIYRRGQEKRATVTTAICNTWRKLWCGLCCILVSGVEDLVKNDAIPSGKCRRELGQLGEKTEKRHAQFCLLAVAVTLFHSIDTYICVHVSINCCTYLPFSNTKTNKLFFCSVIWRIQKIKVTRKYKPAFIKEM